MQSWQKSNATQKLPLLSLAHNTGAVRCLSMAADDASDGGSFCDWEEADATDDLISALGPHTLPSVAAWWAELADASSTDLLAVMAARGLDFHGKVRMVNFCRSRVAPAVASGDKTAIASAVAELEQGATWEDDSLLVPVLADDAVIRRLQEEDDDWSDDEAEPTRGAAAAASSGAGGTAAGGEEMVSIPARLLAALRRAAAGAAGLTGVASADSAAAPVTGAAGVSSLGHAGAKTSAAAARPGGVSEGGYFGGYAETGIHVEMLQDVARTQAYKSAIEDTVAAIGRGASVVDIGAGTGILSLFAARAGAAATAVEASPLAHDAMATAAKNGLDESGGRDAGFVRVLRRRAEDVSVGDLPGARRCDAVVSEWMGYALLFEDMLPAVIRARDELLAPGGRLLPDRATVLVAGVSDRCAWRRAAGFWRDAWGFDMSHLDPRDDAAAVQQLRASSLCTHAAAVADLDLLTCNAAADLEPRAKVRLAFLDGHPRVSSGPAAEAGEAGDVADESALLHGVALWFTVAFEGRELGKGQKLGESGTVPVHVLSTAPSARLTHWQQTVFWFDEPVPADAVTQADGTVSVSIDMRRDPEANRCYTAKVVIDSADGGAPVVSRTWKIQ